MRAVVLCCKLHLLRDTDEWKRFHICRCLVEEMDLDSAGVLIRAVPLGKLGDVGDLLHRDTQQMASPTDRHLSM